MPLGLPLAALGLLGPLALSLLLLAIFQFGELNKLYNTPLPLILGLALLLVPFALLLRILLNLARPAQSLHLARMMKQSAQINIRREGRRRIWELSAGGRYWIFFMLFCWAYFDLTASSLLRPTSMTPVSVLLYNLMHYGQTAGLSAMVLVAFLTPVVFMALARGMIALWHAAVDFQFARSRALDGTQ